MLLEDRHRKWEVTLDNPFEKLLVGMILLAIMSDSVLKRPAPLLPSNVGHLEGFVVDSLLFKMTYVKQREYGMDN